MHGNGGSDDDFTPEQPFAIAHDGNKEPCRVLSNFTLAMHALTVEIARLPHPLGTAGWKRVTDKMDESSADIKTAVGIK